MRKGLEVMDQKGQRTGFASSVEHNVIHARVLPEVWSPPPNQSSLATKLLTLPSCGPFKADAPKVEEFQPGTFNSFIMGKKSAGIP